MEWLGLIIVWIIFGCVSTAYTTGRWYWVLISIWLLPILFMSANFQENTQMNGLMVLTCFIMFSICRKSLLDVRLWNTKNKKLNLILFLILFVFVFFTLIYCFAQAQIQGYMLNIQGWGLDSSVSWYLLLLSNLLLLRLSWLYATLFYIVLDRLGYKKESLTLLSCNFFIATENNLNRWFEKGYFVEGMQNGVNYHFRMSRRTYYMLKKQTNLQLEVQKGMLGGRYVTYLEPIESKTLKRFDKNAEHLTLFVFLITTIVSIYYFWF